MRKEKNFVLLILMVFVLGSILLGSNVFAASASQGLGGTLSISGLQYLPSPAIPGQYLDVYFNIQHNKEQTTQVQCELRPEYPFSLDANENVSRNIGSIGPGQNFVLKYKVRVDAAAILGDNNLKIACKTQFTDWIEAEVKILVQSQAKSLVVENVLLEPSELAPGSKGVLIITMSNIASTPVRDVSVKLDLSSETIPLAPIEGGTEKIIPFIGGNEKVDLSFKLVALADASAKAYKIPLKISFKDYLGNSYSLNETAGIVLSSKPLLDVFVEERTLIRDNSKGTVLVKIVNRGLGDAKFLNVLAGDTASVSVIEPKEFYVGNLDSDDFETIEYELFVSNSGSTASMPLSLHYRDSNNDEYSQEAKVEFKLYSEDEITRLGLEQRQDPTWLLAGAILVGAFLLYWFVLRKRARA